MPVRDGGVAREFHEFGCTADELATHTGMCESDVGFMFAAERRPRHPWLAARGAHW